LVRIQNFLVFTGLWRPIRNLLTKMILW